MQRLETAHRTAMRRNEINHITTYVQKPENFGFLYF